MGKIKKWDGYDIKGQYIYPKEDIDKWNMVISEEGTIYYKPNQSEDFSVWCVSHELSDHMMRLYRIGIVAATDTLVN